MALGPVGQIHISVSDIDISVAFYRDVLGIPLLFQVPQMPMAFFASGDVRLYLLGVPESPQFRSKVVPLLHGERHRCGVRAAPRPARALVHRQAPRSPPRRQWRALDDIHPRPRRPLDRPHAAARNPPSVTT